MTLQTTCRGGCWGLKCEHERIAVREGAIFADEIVDMQKICKVKENDHYLDVVCM